MSAVEEKSPVKLYLGIMVILCLATLLEWAIFKIEDWGYIAEGTIKSNNIFVGWVLVIFSLIKFILVCWWYMHLKSDHRILTVTYISGIVMASATFAILWLVI